MKKQPESQPVLWTVIGDNSGYEQWGQDIDAVICVLLEARLGDFIGFVSGGLETTTYPGNNFISLYWGDAEGNLLYDLSPLEQRRVRDMICSVKAA